MDKQDREQLKQLVDMFVEAAKKLGARATVISIDVGEGCLVSRMGQMFAVARLMRETNHAVMDDVPSEHLQEFAKIVGAKIVGTKEEYDKLTGNEPEFDDFEMPPGSYHSKTVH